MIDMSPKHQQMATRNHICFFWKKQMPFIDDIRVQKHKERPPGVTFAFSGKKQMSLTDDRLEFRNTSRGPGVTFAFSAKSKCHSQMTNMSPETQPEAPRSHICFFHKKQMSLTDDRYEFGNTSRGPGVTFAFSAKSKCHSQMTDMSPETQPEVPRSHICFFEKKQMLLLGPLLVFLDSYLSSVSDICFFRKSKCDSWWPHIYHL